MITVLVTPKGIHRKRTELLQTIRKLHSRK